MVLFAILPLVRSVGCAIWGSICCPANGSKLGTCPPRLLKRLPLSDNERTGHLPKLVEDLALRLSKSSETSKDSDAVFSDAARAHGELRYRQGYTPAMLVHESRILQVTIFGTLQSNLNSLDFSVLLPDVMTIADEVDAQLTQSMESYMQAMRKSAAA